MTLCQHCRDLLATARRVDIPDHLDKDTAPRNAGINTDAHGIRPCFKCSDCGTRWAWSSPAGWALLSNLAETSVVQPSGVASA